MASFIDRLQHAWTAFKNNDSLIYTNPVPYGTTVTTLRPDRIRLTRGNERSLITAIYNRIALDVASIDIMHVRLDDNGRYKEDMDSHFNQCLTVEANKDQTAKMFIQDVCMSMFDDGCVAIVPTETDIDPRRSGGFDIFSMRTAQILEWMPDHVKVRIYNDVTGNKDEMVLPKKMVAIIENPLYAVMNEPNSILQRLIRKMNLLDVIDEQSGAGKLDMIIQLPYTLKTEAKKVQAEQRRTEIERQLDGSKYGIAYTDATEKITQLNRPLENNLMKQIEYLSTTLYSQLGITTEVLNGTAQEQAMLNYYSRTVDPIICAIVDEMRRKFLTKTARSQKQSILYFRDPFKLVPLTSIANIADTFTRNEIMSSNEIRQIVGLKPVDNARADELRNKNIAETGEEGYPVTQEESQEEDTSEYEDELSELEEE